MDNQSPINPETIRRAFLESEARQRLGNTKVGCALVVFLMPLGSLVDYFVFREEFFWPFMQLRLVCSAIAGLVWAVLFTEPGKRGIGWLSKVAPLLPAAFLAVMIAKTDGFGSTYYAAINLVLLAVGVVLHWSVLESFIAVVLGLVMFVAAGIAHSQLLAHGQLPPKEVMVTNFYFIVLMDIIVVVGTYFQYRSRSREFAAKFELDRNKQILEISNQKLDDQNKELADTIQKLTEAESQLVQSEKMASLGRMSAGIIHEINNPLNFATTSLFTLRKKAKHIAPEQKADYEDILKDVEDGISRVKNIVSDLRMFTHPSTEELDNVDASEAVASALRFLSNELKDKVTIEQKLPEKQAVHANKNKLIHVFVNLLQNSLDALRSKPFTNGEKPTIWIEGRVENGASCLIVRDNGTGIAGEHLDKIFDPFFTTKEVGAGMGLGLSICYRILHESQGRISVRTEVGKFCEFTLEFPVKA
ncbi:MAG: ATP-binding protein [Verrucomicrobiota bacterium]